MTTSAVSRSPALPISGINHDAAGRIDLFHFVSDEEASHIEVVNGHVDEDAAGDADVAERRGRGVAADDVHQIGAPISPLATDLADASEVGIEAAVESDLQFDSGGFYRCQGAVDLVKAVSDGLLAEDMLAGFGGLHDEIGMSLGGGADEHGLDGGVGDYLRAGFGDSGNAAVGGQRFRGLAIQVGNRYCLRLRQTESQCLQRARGRCGPRL